MSMRNNKVGTVVMCGVGLTKQSFSDECDINKIIARYDKSGMISNLNSKEPFYGDVTEFVDLQKSLDMVKNANDLFMSMSADVRKKFDNDPVKMVEYLNDEKNIDEAIKIGLIVKKEEVINDVVNVVK